MRRRTSLYTVEWYNAEGWLVSDTKRVRGWCLFHTTRSLRKARDMFKTCCANLSLEKRHVRLQRWVRP